MNTSLELIIIIIIIIIIIKQTFIYHNLQENQNRSGLQIQVGV